MPCKFGEHVISCGHGGFTIATPNNTNTPKRKRCPRCGKLCPPPYIHTCRLPDPENPTEDTNG